MIEGSGTELRSRFLGDSELNYLRYGLRLDGRQTLIKRTLQAVCHYYEAGRRIAEPGDIRQLIHSHLGSQEAVLRRWSMKALALIGHRDDTARIVDRLRVETDVEAQTWGIAGILKNARSRGLQEVCDEARLEKTSAITLAARLYAPMSWISAHAEQITVSLHDDELALKWAIFLIGYGKAPEELFHPRYSNEVFLGELNTHDSQDISEYSIWALWERKDYDARYLRIPLDQAARHPESVRKWLYRLATQSADMAGLDVNALSKLWRDESVPAREGLALGVVDLDAARYAAEVVEWYCSETSPTVRDNLLASMAARSLTSEDYAALVASRFSREPPGSALRHRLLAASVATPLYPRLIQIRLADEPARQGLLLMEGTTTIHVRGDMNVSGPSFTAGRDINAQNLVTGDMIGSANAAVQQMDRSDRSSQELLAKVLAMLRQADGVEGKVEIAGAVEKMAKAPSEESKKGLIEALKSFGQKAAALGTAVGGLDKLIEAVHHLAV